MGRHDQDASIAADGADSQLRGHDAGRANAAHPEGNVKFPTYALVVAIVVFSAGALTFQNYPIKLAFVLFIAAAHAGTMPRYYFRNQMLVTSAVSAMMGLLILVPLLRNDPDLSPYFTIATTLLLCLLVSPTLPMFRFMETYINVLVVLAGISLCFFTISFIAPSFLTALPVVEGEFVNYKNAFFHVYTASRNAGAGVFARNSGIAWEPGAYAVLLSLAILFLLDKIENFGVARLDAGKLALLTLTMITTSSILGYVCLGVLGLSYGGTVLSVVRTSILKAFALFLVCVGVMVSGALRSSEWRTTLDDRLSNYFGGGLGAAIGSVQERLSLDRVDSLHPSLLLVGDSFTSFAETGSVIHNSIMISAIGLGAPFTAALLFMYRNFALQFRGHSISVFFLLVACFATENFFYSFLFLFIAVASSVQGYSPGTTTDSPTFRRSRSL